MNIDVYYLNAEYNLHVQRIYHPGSSRVQWMVRTGAFPSKPGERYQVSIEVFVELVKGIQPWMLSILRDEIRRDFLTPRNNIVPC